MCNGAGGAGHDLGRSGPVQKERGPQCFIFVSPKLDKVFEVADWRWSFLYGINDHGAGTAWLGSVVYGHYLNVWPWVKGSPTKV